MKRYTGVALAILLTACASDYMGRYVDASNELAIGSTENLTLLVSVTEVVGYAPREVQPDLVLIPARLGHNSVFMLVRNPDGQTVLRATGPLVRPPTMHKNLRPEFYGLANQMRSALNLAPHPVPRDSRAPRER